MKMQQDYEKDFYAWALESAQLIREGKFTEVDIKHLAEEVESMGKSDRRKLISHFAVLLAHLLKWQFQPERRSNSWQYTIKTQRFEVNELLIDSPSLKYELDKQLEHAYEKALLLAANETGLSTEIFPKVCPFSLEETLDNDFFPRK